MRQNPTADRWLALVLLLAFLLCHGAMGSVHQITHTAPAAHGTTPHAATSHGAPADHSLMEHALISHAAAGHGAAGAFAAGDSGWSIGYFAVLLLLAGLPALAVRLFRRVSPARLAAFGYGPVRRSFGGVCPPRGPTLPRLQVFLL